MNEIDISRKNSTILITLNRQKVLNALNLNMVRKIYSNINEWNKDNSISGVVIKGAGEKSFCAGGDIVSVYHSKGKPDSNLSEDFFREEYILNLAISNFTKPWISILNGIAMGGGLGLSVHGSHRIVNEKTLTAMPETAIGLFPDVGGGYFLSRMESKGLYLALTGKVMNGIDTMYSKIGTHFIDNAKIDKLLEKIINQTNYSKSFIDDLLLNSSVTKFEQESTLKEEDKNIKKHFNKEKLEDIFNSLEGDNSEWAKNTLKVLSKKSPTSMSVTIKQLSKAKNLSLKECLKMEFRICQAMMSKHDFYEGVRANLVEKDKNPNWDPRNILNVSDLLVEEHFKDLGEKELFIDE